jgi:DNA-binding GntR family transcriptional regulator
VDWLIPRQRFVCYCANTVAVHTVYRIQIDIGVSSDALSLPRKFASIMNLSGLNKSLRPQSLVDSIYETLVEAIVSGQLPHGSELNSVGLAKQLEVSRTPLREALRLLERDGLVHQEGNHKARVAEFSADDIREIYEVRLQLEAAAAELAAKRISTELLSELRSETKALSKQTGKVDWCAKAIAFDLRFHEAIATASGNKRLKDEIQRYRLLVRSFCVMTGRQATLQQALNEHITILDALASGRPAAARKAMTEHITSRLNEVLSRVTETA